MKHPENELRERDMRVPKTIFAPLEPLRRIAPSSGVNFLSQNFSKFRYLWSPTLRYWNN